MKLFKHKHKWHIINHLTPHRFENGDIEEAVILKCDCNKCDMADMFLAHRVSELQGAFTEGRDSIIRFLDRYNSASGYARNKTYDEPEFWKHLCHVGFNNQQGGNGSKIQC